MNKYIDEWMFKLSPGFNIRLPFPHLIDEMVKVSKERTCPLTPQETFKINNMNTAIEVLQDKLYEKKAQLQESKERRDSLVKQLCSQQQAYDSLEFHIGQLAKDLDDIKYGRKPNLGSQENCEINRASIQSKQQQEAKQVLNQAPMSGNKLAGSDSFKLGNH